MRVKLTVVNTERGGDARTYVLEQESIVVGRAGTADLPLEDPDRVVSKRHAEIRTEGEALRVLDMGSKNHTFVNGVRVSTSGAAVRDGDKVQVGPFQITVEIDRDRLVADDLDRTVFGAAFANPFADQAAAVSEALGELRRAFTDLDYSHRADALRDALRDALGPGAEARAIASLVAPAEGGSDVSAVPPAIPGPPAEAPPVGPEPQREAPQPPAAPPADPAPMSDDSLDDLLGPPVGDLAATPPSPPASDLDDLLGPPVDPDAQEADASPPFPTAPPYGPPSETPDPGATAPADDPFGPPAGVFEASSAVPVEPPAIPGPPAGAPAVGPEPQTPAGPDALHEALGAVVARLISIPGKFRHEFLGHTVIHAPETAFLFDADVEALLRHLTPDDPALAEERQAILADAAEAVLQHHQSLLEGYRAAAKEGAAILVNGIDPDQIADQAKGGGPLPGGRERAVLDLVRERCAMMRGEDFAAAERRVYRPAFSRAYLESMAHARASQTPPRP